MQRKPLIPAVLGVVTLSAAQEPARFELALRDGSLLLGQQLQMPQRDQWQVQLAAGGRRDVALAEVVALHAAAVAPSQQPAFHLTGGDVLRGLLVGGDAQGENFEVQSAVLGRQRYPVDRLECLLFQPDLADPRQLQLPQGVAEAIFVKAELGLDRIGGTLHQFGEPGVRFQTEGARQPRWYSARELVALRLSGTAPDRPAPAALLVSRAGDRLGVVLRGISAGRLEFELENGSSVALALGDIGCLTLHGRGMVFASSLQPVEVREVAFDGEVLWPHRVDAAVTGGPLVAGGRTHGRGFGVHSQSRLVFAVPEQATHFLTRVAFDDSAVRLPVRGIADVRVLVDDRVVFEHKGLRAGDPPRSTGPLPVRPGQRVALEVGCGEGRDLGDRIDWLTPVFLTTER